MASLLLKLSLRLPVLPEVFKPTVLLEWPLALLLFSDKIYNFHYSCTWYFILLSLHKFVPINTFLTGWIFYKNSLRLLYALLFYFVLLWCTIFWVAYTDNQSLTVLANHCSVQSLTWIEAFRQVYCDKIEK